MRFASVWRPFAGSINCELIPDLLRLGRHRPPGGERTLVKTQLLQLRFGTGKHAGRLLLVVAILTPVEVGFIPD
jgi:hypothetical protein